MPKQAGSTEKRLQVIIYLYPILYEGTKIINGYSTYFGEELENPIKERRESIINDCKFVIQEAGFTVKSINNNELMKPEVVLTYCKDHVVYGSMTVKLRISDDPDVTYIIRYLREREVVHFQRFGELLDKLQSKIK